jgi:hypothetical protein
LSEKEQDLIADGRVWEIADITFHKNDMAETELLCELDRIDREKKTLIR